MTSDNIVAISTGLVTSGVAVIRLSGSSPLSVAEKMFRPVGKTKVIDFIPNKMYVGEVQGEGFTDFGMCVYFKAPKSFTGEDTVEFHIHGGVAIAKGVLKYALKSGARLATNGEFTKRAFINGKLSLSSAEGLIDMINGESVSAVKAGYSLYREKLSAKAHKMQDILTDALSAIDVDMDFPEENLDKTTADAVNSAIEKVLNSIDALLSTYGVGRVIKSGVKVAIVGKPNVGKSSLLNALLDYDKAIVSSTPGTTRDAVEGSVDIDGVRFNFFDTAGIRDSAGDIESIGVTLSKKIAESSDLILFMIDAGNFNDEDAKIKDLVKDGNVIHVVNKIDECDEKFDFADVYVSAKEKTGLDKLREKLIEKTVGAVDLNGEFLCEERHYDALKRAKNSLEDARENIGETFDVLSIDIKSAWDALGEITGLTATEEIIDNIFKKFCVGK